MTFPGVTSDIDHCVSAFTFVGTASSFAPECSTNCFGEPYAAPATGGDEATAPVALALLLSVALRCLQMALPVLLLVAGMRIAPPVPAMRHGIGVEGIGTNLVVMVFTTAATLASHLAANGLLRTIRGKLENLLAVTAVEITHLVLRIRIEFDYSVRKHR